MSYLTMQDIFTAAYTQSLKKEKSVYSSSSIHIITQKQAYGTCLYRSDNGKKCFVGALIPDELYEPNLEHRKGSTVLAALGLLPHRPLPDEGIGALQEWNDTQALIIQLQKIHDTIPIEQWDTCLRKLAEDYHLQIPTATVTA